MQHNVRHTDRKIDKDHAPTLRPAPSGDTCGTCGAAVEVVAEGKRFG